MNPPKLRTATPLDADTIARLQIENWRDAYRGFLPDWYLDGAIEEERRQLWKSRLSGIAHERQHVVIAETSGNAAGFTCVLLDKEPQWGACLDNLHVLPDFRRLGIGRALFSQAARWVLAAAPDLPIHLWVFEANSMARGFYTSLGGALIEVRQREILLGIVVSSCLYLWEHPDLLLNKLNR
ncbi:MAG: GNAT family N-acetyltransferase [Desulfobacteraceae bacterium]|nr:MAG: GNAT family N-acetyltransferase [Desulfobacteraceae bacterium]